MSRDFAASFVSSESGLSEALAASEALLVQGIVQGAMDRPAAARLAHFQ